MTERARSDETQIHALWIPTNRPLHNAWPIDIVSPYLACGHRVKSYPSLSRNVETKLHATFAVSYTD